MNENCEHPLVEICRLTKDQIPQWRGVRLRALRDAPDAFGSTYEAESLLDESGWAAKWESWTGSPGGVWVAMTGESAVGLVGCVCDREVAGRAWLISMWVAPEVRGRGYGKALINAAIVWSKIQGLAEIRLEVTSNNPIAERLYEQMGFTLTGKSAEHPRRSSLCEKEMVLPLGG